jgi:hypothetical protein
LIQFACGAFLAADNAASLLAPRMAVQAAGARIAVAP